MSCLSTLRGGLQLLRLKARNIGRHASGPERLSVAQNITFALKLLQLLEQMTAGGLPLLVEFLNFFDGVRIGRDFSGLQPFVIPALLVANELQALEAEGKPVIKVVTSHRGVVIEFPRLCFVLLENAGQSGHAIINYWGKRLRSQLQNRGGGGDSYVGVGVFEEGGEGFLGV